MFIDYPIPNYQFNIYEEYMVYTFEKNSIYYSVFNSPQLFNKYCIECYMIYLKNKFKNL